MSARAFPAITALLLCLAAGACPQPPGGDLPVLRSPLPGGLERIVVVSIDTLRADHLGCYGYPRDTSPFIDRLAAEGVLFENAYCSMSTTSPSHATMFTALHPRAHGITRNGLKLAPGVLTIAEALRDLGFATAGFVSTNAHFKIAGLDRGFEVFDEARDDVFFRRARETADAVEAWLRGRGPEPRFFLFVHFYDVHGPYRAPSAIEREFKSVSPARRAEFERHVFEQMGADRDFWSAPGRDLWHTMNKYDASVRYVDTQIERLYGLFRELGLDRRCLWVVTADHGEALGNHRWMFHDRHVYVEEVRAPLLFHFPGAPERARRVADVVELADLAPTLAALVGSGFEAPGSVHGEPLLPLLLEEFKGKRFSKKHAFCQRRSYFSDDPAEVVPSPDYYEPGERCALIEGGYSYILWTAGEDELYDLARDPYQLENVAASLPDVAADMRRRLERLLELMRREEAPSRSVDEEYIRKLRALGYLQ